ncbi:MAG: radical SAM protein [Deltaproteobacteria bacterium]|nr:radical SAM protein [Deltaproteobacteria bacterium]
MKNLALKIENETESTTHETDPSFFRKERQKFFKQYLMPKLFFLFRGFPKNAVVSIDVTNKCNLRCKHCYFFAYEQKQELTPEQWLERLESLKKQGFPLYSATWVGGDPMLRKDLIEVGRKYFRGNIIVTNGTFALPDWKDVYFHISVDGTESYHNDIRGKDVYQKLKKNIHEAPEGLNISLATCLNKRNLFCMEDLLEEWAPNKKVKHILFDFFTPVKGVKHDLFIPFEEQEQIIDRILHLKKTKYGDFIGISERVLELMKGKERHKALGNNCVFLQKGHAFDPMGNKKDQCMMGKEADCERCGCVVPFYLKQRTERKYILQEMWADFKKWTKGKEVNKSIFR